MVIACVAIFFPSGCIQYESQLSKNQRVEGMQTPRISNQGAYWEGHLIAHLLYKQGRNEMESNISESGGKKKKST